jgi:hypothetical protein
VPYCDTEEAVHRVSRVEYLHIYIPVAINVVSWLIFLYDMTNNKRATPLILIRLDLPFGNSNPKS